MKWIMLFAACSLFGTERNVYQAIPDHKHPRMCDWVRLQEFLKRGDRPELMQLESAIDPGGVLYDYRCRARRFRLIGRHFWQRPRAEIVKFGEKGDCCVITYASFNQHYPEAVKLLQEQLEKIGFQGHFFYRIGGWPDLEGGSLTLAHVPYAFKPCLFREAKRLGYRKILWLDASIRPLKPLDFAFQKMEDTGVFFYPSGNDLARYCSQIAADYFDVSAEELRGMSSVAAGIIGLDLDHPNGQKVLDLWMEAAQNEEGFLSPRPEQNALSMIAYQLGLGDWEPFETLSFQEETNSERTRFFIDYRSVQ